MPLLSASDRVDTPSAAYSRQAERWRMIDDLCGGTQAMRAAGVRWLPKEEKELHPQYEFRRDRSVLYAATGETIETGAARMFAKPVTLQNGDKLSERLQEIEYDADLAGTSLTEFGRQLAVDGAKYGRFHYLVDFPATDATSNLRDEQTSGVRPYFVRVCPTDLIGWKTRRGPGGKLVLSQIRVRETATKEDGQFGEKEVRTIRVLNDTDAGATWEVWTQQEAGNGLTGGGDYTLTESGTISLGRIPLVSGYYDYIAPFESNPPYEDLGWLNIKHWQLDSDLCNLARVASVPILTAVGLSPTEYAQPFVVGPTNYLKSTNPDARFTFTEHTGAALGALGTMIRTLEDRMEVFGLAPLVSRSGAVTATAKAIDESKSGSDLEARARVTEQAIYQGYEIAAEWVKEDLADDFSADLTAEIGLSLRGTEDMATLLAMKNAGTITAETVNSEAKRRGILGEMVDPTTEAQAARDNPPFGLLTGGGSQPVAMGELDENGMPVPVADPETATAGADSDSIEGVGGLSLNGAQITAVTGIVVGVADGTLPRDSGKGQLVTMLGLSDAQAEAMLGSAGLGTTTTPNKPEGGEDPDPNAPQPAPTDVDAEAEEDVEKAA